MCYTFTIENQTAPPFCRAGIKANFFSGGRWAVPLRNDCGEIDEDFSIFFDRLNPPQNFENGVVFEAYYDKVGNNLKNPMYKSSNSDFVLVFVKDASFIRFHGFMKIIYRSFNPVSNKINGLFLLKWATTMIVSFASSSRNRLPRRRDIKVAIP